MLKPPAALLSLIRRFEGLRRKPYLCPAGVPTIGYGSTGPHVTMRTPPITPAVAEQMMQSDALKFTLATASLCPTVIADEPKLAALADFAYNLGATRLAGSTLRRKVQARDWDAAGVELAKWVRGGGRILPGLVARRAAERVLLTQGAKS